MTNPLPKWIQKRYSILWNKFKNKPFSHEDASRLLSDNEQVVSVFISDLRKAGWVEVTLDQKDTRMRRYVLKEPNIAMKEMVK